jgi:hypothetical protein
MKVFFNIAERNDKRYNITFWTMVSIGIAPMLTICFNIFDYAPKVFLSIMLIGLVGIYLVRYLFNDYKKIGELVILDTQIKIYRDNQTKIVANVKKIGFRYEGFFGSAGTSTLTRFPNRDGTGNLLSLTYENNSKEDVNIYLDNRDEKEKLVTAIKTFSTKNGIEPDLGYIPII